MTRWMLDIPTRPFFNNSGEAIPQFACMQISGSILEKNDSALVAQKPDASSVNYDYSRFAFNTGAIVPAGGYGSCQLWYPALAVIDGAVSLAQGVGPVSGSWYLSTNSQGKFWRASNADPAKAYYASATQRTYFVTPIGMVYDIHFQYQLLTNWSGGLAVAYVKTMDGVVLGPVVPVRDPLAIFSYQKRDDRGYMVYQPHVDKFYAIQAPCGRAIAPPPPPPTTGACCYYTDGAWQCSDIAEADCSNIAISVWKGLGTECATTSCP